MRVCSICNKPIAKGERWTSAEGKAYHWECFKQLRSLPPRGTGLVKGTARQGGERGRGRPLTEEERVERHRRLHGGGLDPPSLVSLREAAEARSLAAARELAWSVFKAVRRGDWEKARRVAEDLKAVLEKLGLGRLGEYLLRAVEAEKPRAVYKLLVRILYIIARMLGRRVS